jgi:hypothetical protein
MHHLRRLRRAVEQIASDDDAIYVNLPHIRQHRFQRGQVAVNVSQNRQTCHALS